MPKFILTYKLECSTQKGKDTYDDRYDKLFEFLDNNCKKYIKDDTTSTVICEADMPLYNGKKKSGLAYKMLQEKFLLNKDEILFFKFMDGKCDAVGRIQKEEFDFDHEIEEMLS